MRPVNDITPKQIAFSLLLVVLASCSPSSNDSITMRNDATSQRQNMALSKLLISPTPKEGMWRHETFAMAAYWLNQETAAADDGIMRIKNELFPESLDSFKADGFHWHAYILERIYYLFSSNSQYFPGRISAGAEEAILEMLWAWSEKYCRIELTLPERIWWIWGSENHHLQAWVSFWGAAQIFKHHPEYKDRKYRDGSTPAHMSRAFDDYFKLFLRERAAKGLMVEIAAPTYAKYSLNALYNIADFAENVVLKNRMDNFLNLYWAEWAIEQIDGVRGGSRHRCYPGSSSIQQSGGQQFAWYHFGTGPNAMSLAPGNICATTTFWRPSEIVNNLALNWHDRGEYGYTSRCMGLKKEGGESIFVVDPDSPMSEIAYDFPTDSGGILRYTWSTPDFVMGMSEVEALPENKWNKVSSQNRWNGVIFSGSHTARIFTQPERPAKGSVYNAEWGVQNKGVMILQRLKMSNAKGQRIWLDKTMPKVEKEGWYFLEAPRAYVAVYVANGSAEVVPDDASQHHTASEVVGLGDWLVPNDEFSPIIIEVGRKNEFHDLSAFQKVILSNPLTIQGSRVDYRSELYRTTLTLYSDYSQTPMIDGVPLNFRPKRIFDSPYLQSEWDSGIVTIHDGSNSSTLDFNR